MKVFFLFMVFLISCKEEDPKYSKEALLKVAQNADPTVTIILPRNMADGIHCSDYPEGCLSAHIVKAQNLEFIAVEFSNTDQAIYAAKKFRGYYVRNWLLDDVVKEPALEKFVETALEAKKP